MALLASSFYLAHPPNITYAVHIVTIVMIVMNSKWSIRMAREDKKRSASVVERMTLRIPQEDWAIIRRYCAMVPGSSPSGLVAEMVKAALPSLEQALDAMDAINAGNEQAGMASFSSVVNLLLAQGEAMRADVEVARARAATEVNSDE